MLAIEHCNRLGWPKEFSFPSSYAMNYTGIATYKTYIKALNDLIEFGFIKLIKKAKNQFSANTIALVDFTKVSSQASTKAMDRALFNAASDGVQIPNSIQEPLDKEEILKQVSGLLNGLSLDKKTDFFDKLIKQEDFQAYLWQNFETFQSSARSEIQAEPDFDLCQSIFKEAAPSYVWFDEDNKHLKSLVQKIQSSIKQTQSKVSVDETFRFMLDNLPDWWRNKKFTLANLNNNYNEIINEIQQSNGKDQSNTAQELDQYAQNFGK
jgi:hypothetical protein